MIFTGLSNNWALLQRVNAIEKYLNENPIVPYAKASIAGEGTDTFVFNKSQLSVANGADLMVGDLIICPDVTLWQVISIADSGEVTARFLVNFKGEQGIQGEQGEVGENALTYSSPVHTGTVPTTGSEVSLGTHNFNRTPKANETLSLVVNYKNGERSFIALAKIISGGSMLYTAQYIGVVETTGAKGADGESGTVLSKLSLISFWANPSKDTHVMQDQNGFLITGYGQLVFNNGGIQLDGDGAANVKLPLKATNGIVADVSEDGKFIELHSELYMHHIRITEATKAMVKFELLTRSEAALTYESIATLLNNHENSATGYAGKEGTGSPQFDNSIMSVGANNGEIYVVAQIGRTIQLPIGNVSIHDVVEEI